MEYDFLIVGAGFSGCVIAERLASISDKKVLLIDKRNHIAGNTYDYINSDGILIHKYGPHIFHTNSYEVFSYLSRFTEWIPFELKVLTYVEQKLLPFPINLDTINNLYNFTFKSEDLVDYFDSVKVLISNPSNSKDYIISQVGEEIYKKFFKGYTQKQWGTDASNLDKVVAGRIPIRTDRDDRYFTDHYQFMPKKGYTKLFEKLIDHYNIKLLLNTDFISIQKDVSFKQLVYTGSIDEYFGYCYGKLPYRSLVFDHQTVDVESYQPAAIINYPNDYLYTRVTEYKKLTGQLHKKTSISYEYPNSSGDPYYPILCSNNISLYQKYKDLISKQKNIHFIGRLGTYKYYNMDQVVAQALTLFKKLQS